MVPSQFKFVSVVKRYLSLALLYRLYCGFENAIEILEVGSPGKEGFRLHTSATRSSKDGQKGAEIALILVG